MMMCVHLSKCVCVCVYMHACVWFIANQYKLFIIIVKCSVLPLHGEDGALYKSSGFLNCVFILMIVEKFLYTT